MLTRFCNKAGCKNLTDINSSFCKQHTHEPKQRHKEYDAYRRDAKTTAFYKSSEWVHMQKHIIDLYYGLDVYEYYTNYRTISATTVHHIVELTACWDKRLVMSNLIPLSSSNHNTIHALYKSDKETMQWRLAGMLKEFRELNGIKLADLRTL